MEYRVLYMCLEGGSGVRTGGSILGSGGIDACTLGSLAGIVVGFYGGLSVLNWVGLGVGTGFTLGSDAVGLLGSGGWGTILGFCMVAGYAVAHLRIWETFM